VPLSQGFRSSDVPRITAGGMVLPERSAALPQPPRRGLMDSIGPAAQGMAAGLLGAPVDIMTMLTNPILRMIGQNPGMAVGSTEQIGGMMGADASSLPFMIGSMLPVSPADAMMGALPLVGKAASKLDMSQAARMQRAQEQKFEDKPYYFGTPDNRAIRESSQFESRSINVRNRETGDFERVPQATYLTPDRAVASSYADPHRAFDYQGAVPEVMDLRLRGGNLLEIDAAGRKFNEVPIDSIRAQIAPERLDEFNALVQRYADPTLVAKGQMRTGDIEITAGKMGYDGFRIKNVIDTYSGKGKPSEIVATFDPARLRSPDAAFDPAKKDSSNLLAGVAGAGIGTAMLAPQGAEAQQPADMETLNRILRELGIM